MIAKDTNGILKIINWCKYQGNSKKNKNCEENNQIDEKIKTTDNQNGNIKSSKSLENNQNKIKDEKNKRN